MAWIEAAAGVHKCFVSVMVACSFLLSPCTGQEVSWEEWRRLHEEMNKHNNKDKSQRISWPGTRSFSVQVLKCGVSRNMWGAWRGHSQGDLGLCCCYVCQPESILGPDSSACGFWFFSLSFLLLWMKTRHKWFQRTQCIMLGIRFAMTSRSHMALTKKQRAWVRNDSGHNPKGHASSNPSLPAMPPA